MTGTTDPGAAAPTESRRWQRLEALFERALPLGGEERSEVLSGENDTGLRREVEELLRAHDRAAWLDSRLFADEARQVLSGPELGVGQRIGAYETLRELGRGGMSTVYLARRADREYRGFVAIKLIPPAFSSESVMRRFRTERQILADLDHPNIARLLDGGTLDGGSTYLVMEWINGLPIDRYCEERRLSVRRRIDLFLQVCEAVRFAHRSLVVHRDIKPSNILVTWEGVPKLLDFGIAKLLAPESFAQTVEATRTGLQPMTPSYASPEQVTGGAITTQSDVYSLGVLLYKLLTGALPRSPEGAPLTAAASPLDRRVALPSEMATRHRQQLAGDLDEIVLKALRPETERRYASVEELAGDLRAHLQGLPVSARGDALAYRAGKFLRRHALGLGMAAALVALVIGFAGFTLLQSRQIRLERDRARVEAAKAKQVTRVFAGLFEASDPERTRGETLTVRQVMERAARQADRELRDQPEVRASLLDTVGTVYRNLGMLDEGQEYLVRALEIRRQVLGDEHPELAESWLHLGELHRERGDLAIAREYLERSLAARRALLGEDHLDTAEAHSRLAFALQLLDLQEEAIGHHQAALAIFRRHLGDDHYRVALGRSELGRALGERQDEAGVAEAEPLLRAALPVLTQHFGPDHPTTLAARRDLAGILVDRQAYDEAGELLTETLALQREVYGEDHPLLAETYDDLGIVHDRKQDYEAAEGYYRRALRLREEAYGEDSIPVSITANNLGLFLMRRRGDLAGAEELLLRSLAIVRRELPPGAHAVAYPLENLGQLYMQREEPRRAEAYLREALTVRIAVMAEDDPWVAQSQGRLGECLLRLGRLDETEELLLASYRTYRVAGKSGAQATALERLIDFYEATERPAEADRHRELLAGLGGGAYPPGP